jgi:hypothetical protein
VSEIPGIAMTAAKIGKQPLAVSSSPLGTNGAEDIRPRWLLDGGGPSPRPVRRWGPIADQFQGVAGDAFHLRALLLEGLVDPHNSLVQFSTGISQMSADLAVHDPVRLD